MNKVSLLASLVLFLGVSNSALAYQAKATWTASPVAADDVAVMEFLGRQLTIGENILPSTPFKLVVTANSVDLVREVPQSTSPGFKNPTMTMSSLDVLHDLGSASSYAEDSPRRYNIRVYFNTEFIWVEMQKANVPAAPTLNTVFFVGSSPSMYAAYRDPIFSDVKFANYASLKTDIQENYADFYDPRNPGIIQYTPIKRGALVNATFYSN